MKKLRLPQTFNGQVLLCALVSSLFLFPHLGTLGLNGVTRTYQAAALRFWSGSTPYDLPVPNSDWFKYSPAFAMLYRFFTFFPDKLHAMLWGALNFTVYWLGVARWVPAFRDGRVIWIWLIAASMELDGALRYQQVNALLTGMMLWAVADYRDGKFGKSGMLLGFATNWKVISTPFLIGLARRKPVYWIASAVTVSALLLVPALIVGWQKNWEWHWQWLALLRRDAGNGGILDLGTVLAVHLPQELAQWIRIAVGASTFFFLVDPRRKPLFPVAEALWVCIGLTGILLFSPRTEAPTFVLAAPTLPMLWIASRSVGGAEKKWVRVAIVGCFFFLSLVHNDIWPKALWNMNTWYGGDKTLAVFGLWLISLHLAIRKT